MAKSISRREEHLYESLTPIVEPLGVDLIDIEIESRQDQPLVRVIIDTEAGVDTGTCEEVVGHVLPVMRVEEEDLADKAQVEVSSPGVERRMRREEEYDRFSGREVTVTCYAEFEGQKKWQGKLRGYENGDITIKLEDESILRIPDDKVASVRLFFDAESALSSGGTSDDE